LERPLLSGGKGKEGGGRGRCGSAQKKRKEGKGPRTKAPLLFLHKGGGKKRVSPEKDTKRLLLPLPMQGEKEEERKRALRDVHERERKKRKKDRAKTLLFFCLKREEYDSLKKGKKQRGKGGFPFSEKREVFSPPGQKKGRGSERRWKKGVPLSLV